MRLRLARLILLFFLPVCACQSRRAEESGRKPLSIHDTSPRLGAYLRYLENPSRPLVPNLRSEVDKMLRTYAPRIWWHPSDPFAPLDPADYLSESSLWFHDLWSWNRLVTKKGTIAPEELGKRSRGLYHQKARFLWFDMERFVFPDWPHAQRNSIGFYLKFEGEPPRLMNRKEWNGEVPAFWRLSPDPSGLRPDSSSDDRARVLIEYWYYVGYNVATSIGVGNHEGDWEGVAFLLELSVDENRLKHELLAAYYSMHEGGIWYCPNELNWSRETAALHPEAFSALGTHATYPRAGRYQSGWIEDETAAGIPWDTWHSLKPMVLEPYYGYSGGWGAPALISFMSGPQAPGPLFKVRSGWIPSLVSRRCGVRSAS